MNSSDVEMLKKDFSGEVVLPEDANYEKKAASLFEKGEPAIVVFPKTSEDIVLAIKFSQKNSLVLTVRSGGHSVAGFAVNKGGIIIDLSRINQVEIIDEAEQIVRIGTGGRWGEVAKKLQEYDLAISSGDTTTVGVGGLTLAGGIGWMVRKYGMAIDSLVAVEIITAKGGILRASERENSDLFWAIRGGGGNFGIVSYFEFKAQRIGKVYSGTLFFSLENLSELLKGWRDYMREAPEDLTTIMNILPSFGGNPPGVMLTCCYVGDEAEEALAIEPLKKIGKLTREDCKVKYYYEVLEEAHPPGGVKIIVKNVLVDDFSDELVGVIEKALKMKPDMILQIRGLGGAMKRVDSSATAFPYRNSEALLLSPTFISPTATEEEVDKALEAWGTIAEFGKGAYMNFLSTATEKDMKNIYPEKTYAKLSKIKKIYDPENLFNQNYNVKPD